MLRLTPRVDQGAVLPPILTLHGNADEVVPDQHAVRLHERLERAGVPNALHTIPGGNHGGFTLEESLAATNTLRQFLAEHGIVGGGVTSEGQ